MCECVFCHKEKIITDFIYEDGLVMAIVLCKMVASLMMWDITICIFFQDMQKTALVGHMVMKKRL